MRLFVCAHVEKQKCSRLVNMNQKGASDLDLLRCAGDALCSTARFAPECSLAASIFISWRRLCPVRCCKTGTHQAATGTAYIRTLQLKYAFTEANDALRCSLGIAVSLMMCVCRARGNASGILSRKRIGHLSEAFQDALPGRAAFTCTYCGGSSLRRRRLPFIGFHHRRAFL